VKIDGSMIPIVKVDEKADDKRKNKTLQWKEARLCLVHKVGSTTLFLARPFQAR